LSHDHHHHHINQDSKNILIAFFLNFVFAIIEFIGGYYTNSLAIYSDALHDLGDSLALLFAYFAEKLSHKKPDEKYTFGYRRFSVLAAFINAMILMTGSLFVVYHAILRLKNPEIVKPEGMLILAFLGILVNSIAAFRLSKSSGLNQKMVMYHLLEDILGWVGVLIVSVVIFFKPIYELDAILSILISIIIFRGVYKNVIKMGTIFLQKFPSHLELEKIENEITFLKEVLSVHSIKGWSIDESSSYLSFHVEVPKMTTIENIDLLKDEIKTILSKYNISNSTIEFESTLCTEILKES